MGSLFPTLPDGIGLECLLRVELNSHRNLRCVCKSWNAVLNSPQFYQARKRLKISEQRICILYWDEVVVYDMARNSCKTLPPLPARIYDTCFCHFVKQKLVLIADVVSDNIKIRVWLYDFSRSKWRQGAKMPRWRDQFACAADEHGGLIYVAGGCRRGSDLVRSAFVYNVEEDKWDRLPDMNTYMVDFIGAFADGKFYVMGGRSCPSFEVFDSYTRSWKTMENRFDSDRFSNTFVSAFGRLYCFSRRGLIEYDCSQDKLNIVGPLPTEDWDKGIWFAIVVGHNIFVCRWDPIQGQAFYMLAPPGETGGAFKWIDVEIPSGFQGYAIRAATLDL